MQSIRQRGSINLRLVPALAEHLQVETVADVITDFVEAFASHTGTEAEQIRFCNPGQTRKLCNKGVGAGVDGSKLESAITQIAYDGPNSPAG